MKNDQNEKEALIIDPLISDDAISVLDTLTHSVVLFTHSHYDHISGMNWLRGKVSCTLLCSECCGNKIRDSHKNLAAFSNILIMDKTEEEKALCMDFFELDYTCQADKTFESEISFPFGSYQVDITHTPGHSDCSQCIRLRTSQQGLTPEIVFTGDSLVNGHKIITRLPQGSKKDYITVTKPYLEAISEDTLIMPGHGDWDLKKQFEIY
jgi:glyoxylase-like metal-dependent hydrolase (beta-lactamase superfamily II)